jgi:hypothetical protein
MSSTSAIESAERAVSDALARFETDKGKLLDEDGRRIYADEQHAKREEQIARPVFEAVDRALTVEQQAHEAAARLEQEAPADPAAGLPAEVLARAASMAPFVQRDVDTLPLPDLAGRATAAAAGADKATAFAYLRYLPARITAARDQARQGRGLTPPDSAALHTLREAVETLERRFNDPDGKRAAATALKQAAFGLGIHARKTRRIVDGSVEQERAALREHIRRYL